MLIHYSPLRLSERFMIDSIQCFAPQGVLRSLQNNQKSSSKCCNRTDVLYMLSVGEQIVRISKCCFMFNVVCLGAKALYFMKLPGCSMMFEYFLMPRTEGYMVSCRTNTAKTNCRERCIDEKNEVGWWKNLKMEGHLRHAAVPGQPERLRQSAEPCETTHC